MRVLLVEDDRVLADGVARHLRAEHFAVDVLRNGEDARHAGDTEAVDAAVLDLGLPRLDGVLVMRLRAMVRRAAGHASPRIDCGPLAFDAQLGSFELDGLPLRLTALEWRVLSCLALKAGHVVERADLFERVYDGCAEVESNSVEVIVARLRRKLGHPLIETVRGRGYRLLAPAP